MAVLNKPRVEAYIGGTGSGKGVSITARLAALRPKRLIIWDPRNEYAKLAKWTHRGNRDELAAIARQVRQLGAGSMAVRFVYGAGPMDIDECFGMLCRIAFAAGDLVFLAEELSDVTKPSYAPAAWRQVITQGRHKGLHVIGAAQRPALIDKTFLGNATYLRCFTLRYEADRRAMAAALDVPLSDVNALQTVETETETQQRTTINYIERDFRSGQTTKGQVKLARKKGPT